MSSSSRFTRLELDAALQPQLPPKVQAAVSSQRAEERDATHWMRCADAERRNGLFENALRYYSRALELERTAVAGWVGQVQMLVLLGEYPEAELWARKALELFRNHPGLLAARAQALCRMKDLKQAQANCDASLAQPGSNAYCWIVRGEILFVRRDPIEQFCFERALQIDPDWLTSLEIAAIYLFYRAPAKAITHARRAVERAPQHAHCWYVQGTVEIELRLTRPAEQSLRRCLELVPNHAAARRRLEELRQSRGFFRRLFRRRPR